MKNLGNIALLLAAGAGYVASLPTTGVPANQLRAVVDNVAHEIVPRESEKNDKKTAEAGVAAAAGEFFLSFSLSPFLLMFGVAHRPGLGRDSSALGHLGQDRCERQSLSSGRVARDLNTLYCLGGGIWLGISFPPGIANWCHYHGLNQGGGVYQSRVYKQRSCILPPPSDPCATLLMPLMPFGQDCED